MPREYLYQPFETAFKTLDAFPKVFYKNNFFKLVYIMEGSGIVLLNEHQFNYSKECLFLITPADNYSLHITTVTRFFFLNFNDVYIKPNSNKNSPWVQRLDAVLQSASHEPVCILKNEDKILVHSLIKFIYKESNNGQIYGNDILQQIANSLILITARNILSRLPENVKENTGEIVLDILHYIQDNIFKQHNLRIDVISRHFKISPGYLGRYFKKQTGDTLQQYISNYKLRLIEARLLNSDMRINEIAHELNFTDESHLNKIFKKYKGLSPSAFRKRFACQHQESRS